MKHPRVVVTSGAALLFALFAPVGSAQTRPAAGSAVGVGSYHTVSAMQDEDSGSAMDQKVSRKIKEAWTQGKDASGAAAFQENGEIALSKGREQQAKEYFRAAQQELARIGASQNESGMRAGQ